MCAFGINMGLSVQDSMGPSVGNNPFGTSGYASNYGNSFNINPSMSLNGFLTHGDNAFGNSGYNNSYGNNYGNMNDMYAGNNYLNNFGNNYGNDYGNFAGNYGDINDLLNGNGLDNGSNSLNTDGNGNIVISPQDLENLLQQTNGNNLNLGGSLLGSNLVGGVQNGGIQTIGNNSTVQLPRKLKKIFDRNPGAQVVGVQNMGNKTRYTISVPRQSQTITRIIKR